MGRPAGAGTDGISMELRLYDTLSKDKRPFEPLDRNQCAHVCLRADGLRLRPYRQCAAGHRLRRAVPAAAAPLWRRPRHLCPQHHRRRRQDQRPCGAGFSRAGAERGDPQGYGADRKAVPRGRRCAGLPAAHGRAARDRAYRRNAGHHREAGRRRLCLCRRGPRAVLAAGDERGQLRAAALWRARQSHAG